MIYNLKDIDLTPKTNSNVCDTHIYTNIKNKAENSKENPTAPKLITKG